MRYGILGCLFLLAVISGSARAQVGKEQSLTEAQKTGRGLFQQRCAVCHTPPMVVSRPYGPLLDMNTVVGREESIRTTIQEGETGLMPGFKYALEPAEIDAIIKYLKTVNKPSKPMPDWISQH